MHEIECVITVDSALAEHRDRSRRLARDCVCLAVVTAEPIAAELIDKAIGLLAPPDQGLWAIR